MLNRRNDPALRDKVSRLMAFMRRLSIARSQPVRHVDRHPRLLWLEQIRAVDGIAVAADAGPGGVLLRVPNAPQQPEPPTPDDLQGWVDRPAQSGLMPAEPTLHAQGHPPGSTAAVPISQAPDVPLSFVKWLERTWRPWAGRETIRQLHIRLFALHQLSSDQPESVELVLAGGLLHLPGVDDEPPLHIHLLSQPVRIERDQETGDLLCMLDLEAPVRLEADEVLHGERWFDQTADPVLRHQLVSGVGSILDPALPEFLRSWARQAAQIDVAVSESWEPPTGQAPLLSLAPALLARRRGAFALQEYYHRITQAIDDPATPIPLGLAQLIEPIETEDRVTWFGESAAPVSDPVEEPLFPLPANAEQRKIIDCLSRDDGVVVEGPPGTGKTHTIANLVSALLARGQRVLVTSEKNQALRVLRDKLPPEIQDLCVALTGDTARGDAAFDRSVNTIAGRKSDHDPQESAREIEELTFLREALRRHRGELLEQIRALRESELFDHPEVAPGYRGTPAAIARALAGDPERVRWVPGPAEGPPPLSTGELRELIDLMAGADASRESRRTQQFPPADMLPADARVAELSDLIEIGRAAKAGEAGALVETLGTLDDDRLDRLGPVCQRVMDAWAELDRLPADREWALEQVDPLLSGTSLHGWQRAAERLALVEKAEEAERRLDFVPVHVADGVDPFVAGPAFERWAEHLGAGNRPKRLLRSTEQRTVEQYAESVLVKGVPVSDARTAGIAAAYLRLLAIVQEITAAFVPIGLAVVVPAEPGAAVQRLLHLRTACLRLSALLSARNDLIDLLSGIPVVRRPRLDTLAGVRRTCDTVLAVAEHRRGAAARQELDEAVERLAAAVPAEQRPPELTMLGRALADVDAEGYAAARRALSAAREQQAAQLRCDQLSHRLRDSAPVLFTRLRDTPRDPAWTDRLSSWDHAWARACARSWIDRQTAPGRETELENGLTATDQDLALVTTRLVAARAWQACLGRMTEQQAQALRSYRSAMGSVGRGTGRYAERYRQSAREAMRISQAAVPAWVMPIRQILDSVPPRPDSFDVVIIDEASQVSITSLFLLWLAPRVIVVGDDRQCTPSEVSSGALDAVFERLDAELPDLPHYLRTEFTPRSSAFSLLRTRFSQVIRLREHFRSMPEIVDWSSNEFYQDAPLEPVRQFGADRLPPLRSTHVDGGQVEGIGQRLVNRPEAEAVVNSVVACLADPAYAGRTFGVIALQGQAQAELINTMLLDRVDAEDFEERQLRVGTPPDFQGDERHVVWLSMVVAPEQRFKALTRREFQQRFNVAATRAQDQLWLFHSVTAERLRGVDLRRSLLTYVESTGSVPLREMIDDVDRVDRHRAFDSLFEQRVYLDIAARGFHVTPQVESNGRRIDLVVTGRSGRLAVECDGDAFPSTPEQRRSDLHREQELKRCGWRFWRVRESHYHLDPVVALQPLWALLERLGITPFRSGDGVGASAVSDTGASAASDTGASAASNPHAGAESGPADAVPPDATASGSGPDAEPDSSARWDAETTSQHGAGGAQKPTSGMGPRTRTGPGGTTWRRVRERDEPDDVGVWETEIDEPPRIVEGQVVDSRVVGVVET
ncbi:AAA domain-containing protein [Actinoalloteichus hoggarensis]|uniref:AAA domain-containing protein n=1 Tax=Actinoalloteichus hoggarensis TaxID=1470176 RepID=UPI001B802582|nr:AAA domain-containing protein [Actinoalloteichus hoggarensis]